MLLLADKATIDQLGHIWYADQVMGTFIRQVEQDDPSTLFVVTGDHAERFNFASDVSLWALSGIPCYFYGDGIPKDFLQSSTGSHLQIAPTLAELIAPPGGYVYIPLVATDCIGLGVQSSTGHREWRDW